jgi:hypothetical protein
MYSYFDFPLLALKNFSNAATIEGAWGSGALM